MNKFSFCNVIPKIKLIPLGASPNKFKQAF
jgi:hypothetical protein